MRNSYLVAYDIRDPKRLRKIYVKMRGYGEAIQYSVFLCRLSKTEKMLMLSDLVVLIKTNEDSIIIIPLGRSSKEDISDIEFIGVKRDITEYSSFIV